MVKNWWRHTIFWFGPPVFFFLLFFHVDLVQILQGSKIAMRDQTALEGFSISFSKLHSDILFTFFSCIQTIYFYIFISYIFLNLLSNTRLRHYFSSMLINQSHTSCLLRFHHQCSRVFHISHLTFNSTAGWSHQLHIGLYHCSIVVIKYFIGCRLLTAVFGWTYFIILSTKVFKELIFIWWISRAMDKTT